MKDDLVKQGFKEAGASGKSWDGEKPVRGIYSAKKTNVGKHSSNVYVLEKDGLEVDVWGSTVLDSKFENIPINSDVMVESLGEATSKTGSKYKDYRVYFKAPVKTEIENIFPGASEVL